MIENWLAAVENIGKSVKICNFSNRGRAGNKACFETALVEAESERGGVLVEVGGPLLVSC